MRRVLSISLVTLASLSCSSAVERAEQVRVERASPLAAPLPLGAQAWSLSGRALPPSPLSSVELARRSAALDAARKAWEAAPGDADALIWVGRRLAYLGRFREAIDTFSIGVEQHPNDARMLRHRGHRYVSVREFANAIRDLEQAAQLVKGKPDLVEPDGMPNARGIPLETLKSNIHYHLGLARYLLDDFAGGERAYRDAFAVSKNTDNQCSATHWIYQCLLRQGKQAEAAQALEAIGPEAEVVEYQSYFQLCRAYQGLADMEQVYAAAKTKGGVDFATVGYGAGAWNLHHGRTERAQQIFREVLASDASYAFGFIASEAELARIPTE